MKHRWLLAVSWSLVARLACAANLNIWPVEVLLWPEKYSDNVHVTNQGDEPVNLQISAKSWDMDEDGKFIEVDTGDFVFFPRLLTLAPQTAKDLRVGYQGDFPTLEKPYRLYIEELPPVLTVEQQKQRAKMGVQYVLKLSLPIFVMPSELPPTPELVIDAVKTGTVQVPGQNKRKKPITTTVSVLKIGILAPGSHHVKISKIETQLLNTTGQSIAQGQANPHILRILPHKRVFIDVPLDIKACANSTNLLAKIYVDGLTTPYEQRIPLIKGTCTMAQSM